MTPNLAKVRRTLEKRIKVEVDHSLKELRNGHEGAAAYHRDQASIYRSRLFHLDSGLQPFELHAIHHGAPAVPRHERPRYAVLAFIGAMLLIIIGAVALALR